MSLIVLAFDNLHTFEVVGVSQDKTRYGDELFEVLSQQSHTLLPVNPKYDNFDNQVCCPSLPTLPLVPDTVKTAVYASGASRITESCSAQKIPVFRMAPEIEFVDAIEVCRKNQVTEIHGICPVFVLKMPRERWQDLP